MKQKLPYLILVLSLLICSYAIGSDELSPDNPAAVKPVRIVSMNLCTDQLLMLLANPDTILSISHLALERNSSFNADFAIAQGFKVNHNLPEEVISLSPDLIVTGEFQHRAETQLLRQLGYRVETFPVFHNLSEVKKNIQRMATLLHEKKRGEKIISSMDSDLARMLKDVPKESVSAVSYHARGYTQGQNTLMDELMTLAGWHNIANDFAIKGYGQISLESLLLAQPQQLFYSQYAPGTRSQGQIVMDHPVLDKLFQPSRKTGIDSRLLICGGPMNLLALQALIHARNEFQ